jgi:hypothetical protein
MVPLPDESLFNRALKKESLPESLPAQAGPEDRKSL